MTLSRDSDMQRVVVDTVSSVQVDRLIRVIDASAASVVGACVLVVPAGQPLPSLRSM